MSATATSAQLWFLNTLVTVHASGADGNDGVCLIENLAPRGDSPPLHVHHNEDEIFHLLEGQLRFRVAGEETRLEAGGTLVAPKGVPHTYLVESERARWLVVTAHGDFERLVRSVSRPADRHDLPEPASPTPDDIEALAAACRQHGIELAGPPLD